MSNTGHKKTANAPATRGAAQCASAEGFGPSEVHQDFAAPRNFAGNRYVYTVISSRARGLSVGVNVAANRMCNLNCAYCENGNRSADAGAALDLDAITTELEQMLTFIRSGAVRQHPPYQRMLPELLTLKHVAISGEGEPTLSPQFRDAIEAVMHVRARRREFFKIVVLTNSSNLDSPEVNQAIDLLTPQDEVWAKLDAGTEEHLRRVNGGGIPLKRILSNIFNLARRRPVIIQSLFASVNGVGPSPEEISEYAQRLLELKRRGAQIPLVQIYSATRPMARSGCEHLKLKDLFEIARTVHRITGLNAEVF